MEREEEREGREGGRGKEGPVEQAGEWLTGRSTLIASLIASFALQWGTEQQVLKSQRQCARPPPSPNLSPFSVPHYSFHATEDENRFPSPSESTKSPRS